MTILENQKSVRLSGYFGVMPNLSAVLAALYIFLSAQTASAHNSILPEVSIWSGDTASLSVVIETHVAAFTLREPFGYLSSDAADRIKGMSKEELHDYVSGASAYLLTRSRVFVDESALAPASIRYPSPLAILKHLESAPVSTAALPITLVFEGVSMDPDRETRLFLPLLLRDYRLSILSNGVVQAVQFVNAGELSAPLALLVQPSWWMQLIAYMGQGVQHVVPQGWDHMLFIAALALGYPYFWSVLLQASMFTLAHSITLSLAVLGFLTFPVNLVEVIIAISITVMALNNILYVWRKDESKKTSHWRLLLVFVFGLVHGLGFASSFADLNMEPADLWVALAGFNLGVEIAQIGVLATMLLLYILVRERYGHIARVISSGLIATIGLFWTLQRSGVIT